MPAKPTKRLTTEHPDAAPDASRKLILTHDYAALADILEQRDLLKQNAHSAQYMAEWGFSSARNKDGELAPSELAADLAVKSGQIATHSRQFELGGMCHDDLRRELIETAALCLYWLDEVQQHKKAFEAELAAEEKAMTEAEAERERDGAM